MRKIRRVFIFAHCDDELFCLPFLLDRNSVNLIIFLTTKQKSEITENITDLRRSEAVSAAKYLNKFTLTRTLFFEEGVFDGSIHIDFDKKKFNQLESLVLSFNPDEIVTLCFEGGHQDHDSVEVVTRLISIKNNLKMLCCSGYRGSRLSSKLFSVMKPKFPYEKIAFRRFFTIFVALRLMIIYKSQAKTWVGLAPMILMKYSFFHFKTGSASMNWEIPTITDCFYEKRGRAFQNDVYMFLESYPQRFLSKK